MADIEIPETPSLFQVLGLLRPFEPRSQKVRIGPLQDGGAVVASEFVKPGRGAINFQKIREDVGFERDLVARGMAVALYNGSLNCSLSHQEGIRFSHGTYVDKPEFIDEAVIGWAATEGIGLLLRFDIEGGEYDAIDFISDRALSYCSQIVVEFHSLHLLGTAIFRRRLKNALEKLQRRFAVIHVHPNNHASTVVIAGMPVHDVLEVTFVERSCALKSQACTLFPTVLDYPNMIFEPDTKLWFFPFVPERAGPAEYERSEAYANRWLTPLFKSASVTSAEPGPKRVPAIGQSCSLRPLKIIYFAMHEILEFDDLKMFTSRGHKVFSLGHFTHRSQPSGMFRNAEDGFFFDEAWELFRSSGCDLADRRLTSDFTSKFDVVIVNNDSSWISRNREAFGSLLVIFRSIGQASAADEASLTALPLKVKVVRYSDLEDKFVGSYRSDHVIYFSKDLDRAREWVGGGGVRCFHNSYAGRSNVTTPSASMFNELAREFDIELYGANNGLMESSMGIASPEAQDEVYSTTDVYLYAFTVPPSYTLSFVEAMVAGVPILAPTASFVIQSTWEACKRRDFTKERYEIERLLGHDERLLYSSINEAKEKLRYLIGDRKYASEVSGHMLERCSQIFDQKKNVLQWEDFIYSNLK